MGKQQQPVVILKPMKPASEDEINSAIAETKLDVEQMKARFRSRWSEDNCGVFGRAIRAAFAEQYLNKLGLTMNPTSDEILATMPKE